MCDVCSKPNPKHRVGIKSTAGCQENWQDILRRNLAVTETSRRVTKKSPDQRLPWRDAGDRDLLWVPPLRRRPGLAPVRLATVGPDPEHDRE